MGGVKERCIHPLNRQRVVPHPLQSIFEDKLEDVMICLDCGRMIHPKTDEHLDEEMYNDYLKGQMP